MQLASAILVLTGGALGLLSAYSAWWSYSYNAFTISFFPGSLFYESVGSGGSTQSFTSNGLAPLGDLYEAILVLTIIGGVLGLVAGALGIAAVLGHDRIGRYRTVRRLAVAMILVVTAAAVLAPAAQPWAWSESTNTSRCGGLNGTTPCNSFWGSHLGATWGGTTGWYLALSAIVLAILGLLLWRIGRANPVVGTSSR